MVLSADERRLSSTVTLHCHFSTTAAQSKRSTITISVKTVQKLREVNHTDNTQADSRGNETRAVVCWTRRYDRDLNSKSSVERDVLQKVAHQLLLVVSSHHSAFLFLRSLNSTYFLFSTYFFHCPSL